MTDAKQTAPESKPKPKQGQSDIATYNNSLTHEQRIARASEAGKASAAARLEKGFFRRAIKDALAQNGNLQAVIDAQMRKARKGDTNAFMAIVKTAGEDVQQINADIGDNAKDVLCNLTTADKIARLEQFKRTKTGI